MYHDFLCPIFSKSEFGVYIFKRDWSETNNSYSIRQKNFGFAPREAKKVRQNVSLISAAAQYEVTLARKLVSYFSRFYTNIDYGVTGRFDALDVLVAAEFFRNHSIIKEKMADILTNLDLGLAGVDIQSTKVKNVRTGDDEGREIPAPYGVHRKNKKQVKLPFVKESNGTQMILVLLRSLLPTLEHGGIAVIDELESKLHPDVVSALLELFIAPEINSHNAQIIFTCHVHDILNELEKEQIQLVEKFPNNESETWRLSDIRGVRRDENLYGKYRAGAFGAVPDI